MSDLQGEDFAAALDEALAADVVLEAEDGDHESFSFSHALVRRTLLERVTRAHRRRIHARVAEALKASRGDAALLEIAHHLCEARPVSDREDALDYATRAAEQATANLAYSEAVDLFTRATAAATAGRRAPADARAQARDRLPGPVPRRHGLRGSRSDLDVLRGDVADDLVDPGHHVAADAVGVLLEAVGSGRA